VTTRQQIKRERRRRELRAKQAEEEEMLAIEAKRMAIECKIF
jgi:hypothetical protein